MNIIMFIKEITELHLDGYDTLLNKIIQKTRLANVKAHSMDQPMLLTSLLLPYHVHKKTRISRVSTSEGLRVCLSYWASFEIQNKPNRGLNSMNF